MNVLFVNCVSDMPEVHLYRGLQQAGVSLSLILDPRDTSAAALREEGVSVQAAVIKHRFDFEFDALLRRKIKEFEPDIIHAPTSRGVAAALRVTKGTAIRVLTYRGTLGNLSRFSIAARLAHLHPRVAGIFCNCEAVQEFLFSLGVERARLPVVYKGHNPDWYVSDDPYTRADMGIDDSDFVIGCFANIRPLKGIDFLVRAVEKLAEKERHITLLLVGESRDKKLERYCRQRSLEGRVRFMGFRDDVPRLLPLCDVTVMPSIRREGFPRAIVESYGNAIPVICTSVGGMPEIVQHESTGLVVPPGDIDALSGALAAIAANPQYWRNAGQRGRAFVGEFLSLAGYIEKTISAYRSVL